MTRLLALQIIFGLAVFGMCFSGFLSYQELFGQCKFGCPAPGAPGSIFGLPACVYGLIMYTIVAIIAFIGMRTQTLN